MASELRLYIPETLGELLDKMTFMLLSGPKFEDKTGYFPDRNVETSFYALDESLRRLRSTLGEELYRKLAEMSGQVRACYEADPEDSTGETRKAKNLILDMEDLIKERAAAVGAKE